MKSGLIWLVLLLSTGCSKTEKWKEIVLLTSGNTVVVERKVELNFTGGELSNALKRWPTTYVISTKNPINNQRVKWEGSYGLNPIMIDFKDSKSFVVALPMVCNAKIEKFSLAGFPYIFYRSDDGKHWQVILPAQFPPEFKVANLSATYDFFWMEGGRTRSPTDIDGQNGDTQHASSKFFQINIPRSLNDWSYQYKKPQGYVGC